MTKTSQEKVASSQGESQYKKRPDYHKKEGHLYQNESGQALVEPPRA